MIPASRRDGSGRPPVAERAALTSRERNACVVRSSRYSAVKTLRRPNVRSIAALACSVRGCSNELASVQTDTGVVEAARKTNIQLPVILRLEGTNVEEGKKILHESGLNFVVAETMKDAADKVVASARA